MRAGVFSVLHLSIQMCSWIVFMNSVTAQKTSIFVTGVRIMMLFMSKRSIDAPYLTRFCCFVDRNKTNCDDLTTFNVQDPSTIPMLFDICLEKYPSPSSNISCYLGPKICKHVYQHTLIGIAGEFTQQHLKCLRGHFSRSHPYKEADMGVYKTEDEDLFRPIQTKSVKNRRFSHRKLTQDFDGNASISGGSIDVWALSQGITLNSTRQKCQELAPKLWNLDRIDQQQLPLDGEFLYGNANDAGIGQGVTIYILDSGIMMDHQEFMHYPSTTENISRVSYGWNFVDNTADASDFDGHGSHIAGTAAGLQVGVAKGAHLVSVKMLDSNGSGSISNTVAALDWVAANHQKPAVVTMSLGVAAGSPSKAMEDAVKSLVNDHGVVVVVAAGNAAGNACTMSPALVPEAITVAGSDLANKYNRVGASPATNNNNSTSKEGVYWESNQGSCVDLFAPGVDIFSVCGGMRRCGTVSRDTYALASGSSMSVPHVAGGAAILLGRFPNLKPQQVSDALIAKATQGVIDPSVLREGTPNKLLYIQDLSTQ